MIHAGWKVSKAIRQLDAIYKWRVFGWNRYTGRPFAWSVPSIERGYDLSDAFIVAAPTSSPSLGTGCEYGAG